MKGPQALELLQESTCNDVSKLEDGRAHYNGLLYPTGGFVDDIVIYRIAADDYFVVVNASNTDKDFEWFREARGGAGRRGPQRQRRLRTARGAGSGGAATSLRR